MSDLTNGGGPVRTLHQQSTAELVQHASEQLTRLVRDELALAKLELAEKGRHAGVGAGLLGGGGLFALYGVGVLVVAAVLGLALVLPGWLAALIVGVVLLVIGGVLAMVGRKQVRQAVPPMPQSTARGLREDLDTVTSAVRDRRRP